MFGSVIQRGDFTGKGEKRKSRKSTIFGVCAVGCDKTLCDLADSHPAQSCVRTVAGQTNAWICKKIAISTFICDFYRYCFECEF